eukprot:5401084-Pyramimonas_sp.AAC.1
MWEIGKAQSRACRVSAAYLESSTRHDHAAAQVPARGVRDQGAPGLVRGVTSAGKEVRGQKRDPPAASAERHE